MRLESGGKEAAATERLGGPRLASLAGWLDFCVSMLWLFFFSNKFI